MHQKPTPLNPEAPSPSVQHLTATAVPYPHLSATGKRSPPAAGPSTVADEAPEEESPECRRSACGTTPDPADRPAAGRSTAPAAAGGRPRGVAGPRGVVAPPACSQLSSGSPKCGCCRHVQLPPTFRQSMPTVPRYAGCGLSDPCQVNNRQCTSGRVHRTTRGQAAGATRCARWQPPWSDCLSIGTQPGQGRLRSR